MNKKDEWSSTVMFERLGQGLHVQIKNEGIVEEESVVYSMIRMLKEHYGIPIEGVIKLYELFDAEDDGQVRH